MARSDTVGSGRPTSASRSGRDDAEPYRSPDAPESDHWLALGIKVAAAMFLTDLVARLCGFSEVTWSVITAAFLATNPPVESARSAAMKLAALLVGLALGAAGAAFGQLLLSVPALHFAAVGLVVGALATRSSEYLFSAIVATVVTFSGLSGGDPVVEIVVTTASLVLIACLVAPAVVWGVERLRRLRADHRP